MSVGKLVCKSPCVQRGEYVEDHSAEVYESRGLSMQRDECVKRTRATYPRVGNASDENLIERA